MFNLEWRADPCIVDQDIDAPPMGSKHRLDPCGDLLRLREIKGGCAHDRPDIAELTGNGQEPCPIAVDEGQVNALGGEDAGNRRPDVASRARDEGDLPPMPISIIKPPLVLCACLCHLVGSHTA